MNGGAEKRAIGSLSLSNFQNMGPGLFKKTEADSQAELDKKSAARMAAYNGLFKRSTPESGATHQNPSLFKRDTYYPLFKKDQDSYYPLFRRSDQTGYYPIF